MRYAVIELGLGVVLACEAFKISRCMYYYQPKLVDDTVIIDEFSALAKKHPKYGFRKLFMRLRRITINNTTQWTNLSLKSGR